MSSAAASLSPDFNAANSQQRKLLRITLLKLFPRQAGLEMFLEEDLNFVLEEEIEPGNYKERVFELVKLLAARGKLTALLQKLQASEDNKDAPALRDLLLAWTTMEEPREQPAAKRDGLARILDMESSKMSGANWIAGMAALRRRVCLLDTGQMRATGTLIAPGNVLTCAHVVPKSVGSMKAIFDYGVGAKEVRVKRVLLRTEGEWNAGLDYALLELASSVGEQTLADGTVRGWFDLSERRTRLATAEEVLLLHHSGGKGLHISTGTVVEAPHLPGRIAHDCNSTAGSSGSPVVDRMLRLVGLHEASDGTTNWAVRADAIAAELEQRGVKFTSPPARGQ